MAPSPRAGSKTSDVTAEPESRPDRTLPIRHRLTPALPFLAALLSTLWVFRTVLRGQMLGDTGDARWTVALHEHWFQFWQGHQPLRDLNYYFPLHNTLGTSDAFLVQGQVYSLARLLGVGMVESWAAAQFVFFLVGALGVAALSERLFAFSLVRSAFVILTCAGYPILASATHVQLFGFLAASWVILGVIDLVSGRAPARGLILVAVGPPVLALSSWYAMVLGLLVGGLYVLTLALITPWTSIGRSVRQTGGRLNRLLRRPVGWIAVIGGLFSWGLVLYVYLPSRGLLPASNWDEVVLYSPRWSDIANAGWAGGGIWSPVYERLYPDGTTNAEQAYGFTPVVLFSLIVAAALQLKALSAASHHGSDEPTSGPGPREILAAFLTICATIALFLVDERGNGLFRLLWEFVPGFDSIRSPYRVQIFGYGLAFFCILRAFELWVLHQRGRPDGSRRRIQIGAIAFGLLTLICFLEMQRVVIARWQADDMISPSLAAQEAAARQDCDAVILIDPSQPEWVTSINAVIFSAETGVPTPQGYSRSDPLDYPDVEGATDGTVLAQWMRQRGFAGRICEVSAQGVRQLPL